MIRDKSALRALHAQINNDLDEMNQIIVNYVAQGAKADVGELQKLFHSVYCAMQFSNVHSAKILATELEGYLTVFGAKIEYDLEDTQTVLNTVAELKHLLKSPDATVDVDSWLDLINAMRLRSGKHLSSVAAIDSTISKLKTQADNTDMKQALAKTRSFFRHALLALHKKEFAEGFRFLHGATRYLKIAAPENSLLRSFSDEVSQLIGQIEASDDAADSKNIRLLGKIERVLSNRSNENKWKQTIFELQSWLKEHNKDEKTVIKGLLGKSYRRDLTNFLEVLNEAIAENEYQKVKGIIRDSEQLLALVNIQVNFVGHFGLDQLKRLREQVKQTLHPTTNEDSFEVALTSGRKTVCEQSLRTVNGWKLEMLSETPDYQLVSKQLFEMSKSLQLAALPTIAEVALVFSSRIVKEPPLSLTQLAEVVSDIEYALDQEVENELPTGLAHTFDVSFEILSNEKKSKSPPVDAPIEADDPPQLFDSIELDDDFFDDDLAEVIEAPSEEDLTIDYDIDLDNAPTLNDSLEIETSEIENSLELDNSPELFSNADFENGIELDDSFELGDISDLNELTNIEDVSLKEDTHSLTDAQKADDFSDSVSDELVFTEELLSDESIESIDLPEMTELSADAEILEIFLEEANEILDNLSSKIDSWQGHRSEDIQAEVRRDFHTLKGSSRMAGCFKIGELAWSTESLLNRLIEGSINYNRSIADAVRQSAGTIGELVKELKTQGAELSNINGLKETIDAMAESLGSEEDADDALLDIAEVAIDDEDGLQLIEKSVGDDLPQEVLDAEKALAEKNWLSEDASDGDYSEESQEQDYQMIIGDTLGQLALLKDKVQSYQEADKALLDNVLEQVTYNLIKIDLGGVTNDLNMAHQQFFADPENNINWINSNIDRVIQLIEKDDIVEAAQEGVLQTQLDAVVELSFGEVNVSNILNAKQEIASLLSIDEKYDAIQKVASAFNKAADLNDETLIIDGANLLLNQMDALAAGMSIVADEDYIGRVVSMMSEKEILEVPWDDRFEPEGFEEEELDQDFQFGEQDFADIVEKEALSDLDENLSSEISGDNFQTHYAVEEVSTEEALSIEESDVAELQGHMASVLDILDDVEILSEDAVSRDLKNEELINKDIINEDLELNVDVLSDRIISEGDEPSLASEPVNDSSEIVIAEEPDVDEGISEEILVIREIFQQETEELMDTYADGLSQWSDDTQHEILDVIKRVLHTLKGGARLSQLYTVADEAHELEEDILYYDKDKHGDLLILLENRYFVLKEKLHIAFTIGEKAAPKALAPEEKKQVIGEEVVAVNSFNDVKELDDAEESLVVDEDVLSAIEELADIDPSHVLSNLQDVDVVDEIVLDENDVVETDSDQKSEASPEIDAESEVIEPNDLNEGQINSVQEDVNEADENSAERISQTQQERAVDNKFQLSETVRLPVEILENLSGLVAENSASRSRLETGLRTIDEIFGEINTTLSTINEHVRSLEIEAQSQKSFNVAKNEQGENFDSLEMDQYSRIYELSQRLSEMTSDLMDYRASIADKIRDMDVALVQQQRSGREISSELQQTQLVSLNTLVPRVRLMARDISSELNKAVNVSFTGMESKINRHAIQKLLPAMEHILRNALDHGIEKAGDRTQYGKEETGQISISAKEYQSYLELTIEDDGSGIDVQAVKQKAIKKGFITAAEQVSRQQILQFIFRSGFSTAENVTQLSGRGVGMEIVANELRATGGSIDVKTEKYKGTQFVIRIPVNISANTSLVLNAGENNYAIPLVNIRAITRAELHNQVAPFEYGGEQYSLFFFEQVFNIDIDNAETVRSIVILNSSQNIAMAVPEVLGVREITVRPISPLVQKNTGLSGASIDSDGSIVMVVDPVSIIERQKDAEFVGDDGLVTDFTNQAPELTQLGQSVCYIVDDSITVRKVTARLLERNDYQCESAKDGLDALERIDIVQPDIILLDVEMPRMDGFEFLKVIRQSDNHRNTPVIMITSRTGEKHRRMALDLGADSYLGKPYQEQELLAEIERHLGTNEIEL